MISNNSSESIAVLYRPRRIKTDSLLLTPKVGLFGTCGSPESRWRQEIFIPKLEHYGLDYFNPQVGGDKWVPEMAVTEAENLATNEVIVLSISKETSGYASLAESGWAILSALLRGQKLGIYIEEDETMTDDAKRPRKLLKSLASEIQKEYPVFQFENFMEDLALWAAFTERDKSHIRKSRIQEKVEIVLSEDIVTREMVTIIGNSGREQSWRKFLRDTFITKEIAFFDAFKEDWSYEDIAVENYHKLNDSVIVQVISAETEGFGSLAESGLLATSAFLRGQAYGLYIEDHPSDVKSDANRARTLVKAHATRLNEQFPGLVYIASSVLDLANFAVIHSKK